MADIRITALPILTDADPANDPLLIEDVSADATKKITPSLLKTSMSLGNVDNTSDLNKPISTAVQIALDAKQSTLTLTTTGTSGAATLIGSTLNIPQYSGGSESGVSSIEGLSGAIDLIAGTGISITNNGTDQIIITNTGGSGGAVEWGSIGGILSSQTDLQSALDAKQATLVNQTNIKSINGTSLLGSGDLTVGGAVETIDANEGLVLTGTALGTIYNTTISDSVNSVAVGGATAQPASFWKSKTLVQVLDTILFPTILPSILSNKSVSLAVSGVSGLQEIGQTIARTLTATFNRGSIRNGDGTTNPNPLVGAATQYTFTGTGISSTAQAGNTLAVSNTIVSGSNNWAVTVNHDAGTGDYFDNKGNVEDNLDGSRVAGTATDSASAPTITGIYPYFYYKSASPISAADMVTAIENGTATKVVGISTGTLSIPYNLSSQYIAVAYPATSTTKTVYYVTALDNGPITAVFEAVTSLNVDSATGLWTGQSYKIHVSSNSITNSNATIELRNS